MGTDSQDDPSQGAAYLSQAISSIWAFSLSILVSWHIFCCSFASSANAAFDFKRTLPCRRPIFAQNLGPAGLGAIQLLTTKPTILRFVYALWMHLSRRHTVGLADSMDSCEFLSIPPVEFGPMGFKKRQPYTNPYASHLQVGSSSTWDCVYPLISKNEGKIRRQFPVLLFP